MSIYVSSLDDSLAFYQMLFQLEPSKLRPGYAKWDQDSLGMVFSILEHPEKVTTGFGHLGFRVHSESQLQELSEQWKASGHEVIEEMDVSCCYAKQDKIWVHDPDGLPWELYVFKADSDFNAPPADRQTKEQPCCLPSKGEKQRLRLRDL